MKSQTQHTTQIPKPSLDSEWKTTYAHMITEPKDAVSKIKPGQRIFLGTGCATPEELIRALASSAARLPDCEIVHLLTMGEAPYAVKDLAGSFRINSFFISDNVREAIQAGMGSYTPIFLSDIPRLFASGKLPLDVALIQVTPPDDRGMCSLGVSVDIVKTAAKNASLVIAEVNPRMPRTLGDSFMNVYDFDILVPVDRPMIESPPPKPNEITRQIGRYIAALVEDGSTLELGIGSIPHALIEFLKEKKDIGIHTEMFTDSIIELVEAGVINGKLKTMDRGKIVASFCLGTKKLYDYIDSNPVFSFHPTEYVNDPFLISKHYKMTAINVALEVDLTGQVCADSIGERFFSGIGGQVDFNRGAARSKDGKAIIALPSTAKEGTISRIVSKLSPGAGVVTTRGDVHYVVTEYGAAYLHGKTVQDRALALISIAHPDFRADLLKDAIKANYVRPGMADIEGRILIGPEDLKTSMLLDDGTQVSIRPIHPTDEPGMKDLLYALSKQAVYYRFMSALKRFPQKQIQNFVYIDHRNEVSFVATVPAAYGDEIIAIGGYYLDKNTNRAEVAFVVRDDWQNRKIGSFLMRYLVTVAKRNGIAGFTAEVLKVNKGMQVVLQRSGCNVRFRPEGDIYSFELDFN